MADKLIGTLDAATADRVAAPAIVRVVDTFLLLVQVADQLPDFLVYGGVSLLHAFQASDHVTHLTEIQSGHGRLCPLHGLNRVVIEQRGNGMYMLRTVVVVENLATGREDLCHGSPEPLRPVSEQADPHLVGWDTLGCQLKGIGTGLGIPDLMPACNLNDSTFRTDQVKPEAFGFTIFALATWPISSSLGPQGNMGTIRCYYEDRPSFSVALGGLYTRGDGFFVRNDLLYGQRISKMI